MSSARLSFFRRLLSFRLFLIINLGVIGFLCLSLGREFVRQMDIQHNLAELQEEVSVLGQYHAELQDFYTSIQTVSYMEREARLKLGMQKQGEQVVVVQDSLQASATEGEEEMGVEETMAQIASGTMAADSYSNIKKWWFYFFDPYRFDTLKQTYDAML